MYNTTALAVLHDKISARLRSRIATPEFGNEPLVPGKENPAKRISEGDFAFTCPDGRRIEMNEPGVIGDLVHSGNTITLSVINSK
jgi:hypothetical protein